MKYRNDIDLDDLLYGKQVNILPYHKIYSERHNLPVEKIAANEPLDYAAFLEWRCGIDLADATDEQIDLILSLSEARYLFVDRYPKSNCIWYYKESVCNLILPYDCTIREIPKQGRRK